MKKLIAFFLVIAIIFCVCSCSSDNKKASPDTQSETEYKAITQIDHCAVEPDDKLHMTADDESYYKKLMDSMLNQKNKVKLSDNKKQNEYYIDLLMQSPYFFFVKSHELLDDTVHFEYEYSKAEQSQMLSFIDECFLEICNTNANEENNTLDKILNVYGAVARKFTYDIERTDNKQLGSPLFEYPDDEIYKAFKTEKCLCYGFAYTLRFALLQLDIDCFCVYGKCTTREQAHMWNIFKYDGKFYTCDPTWDRCDDGSPHLYHFGKTEKERKSDTLSISGFSSTYFDEYGAIECVDETFKIFRGIGSFAYVRPHKYFMTDYEKNEFTFDTTTFKMK